MTDSATPNCPIRVLLVDNHTIFLEVLRCLVVRCPGIEAVGIAANGLQAMERVETLRPDVVLMDVNMPKLGGIETTRAIKSGYPQTVIIGISSHASAHEAAMLEAGASRVLDKEHIVETLCSAIREAMAEPVVPDFLETQRESSSVTLSSPLETLLPSTLPGVATDPGEAASPTSVQGLDQSSEEPPATTAGYPSSVTATAEKRPIRVLVVDDHAMILDELCALVLRCPHAEVVGCAENGNEALKRMETLLPDLVLMDIHMPQLGGIETTRAIKLLYPKLPVIGISVNASFYRTAMCEAGACRVLDKESVGEELCAAIREAMADGFVKAHNRMLSSDTVLPSALTTVAADSLEPESPDGAQLQDCLPDKPPTIP